MEVKEKPTVEEPAEDKVEKEEAGKTEKAQEGNTKTEKGKPKDKGKSWKEKMGDLFQDIVRNMTSDPEEEKSGEEEQKENNDQ